VIDIGFAELRRFAAQHNLTLVHHTHHIGQVQCDVHELILIARKISHPTHARTTLGLPGTAGVPAGSLPVIAVILGYLHLPPEGIGIILGVDRFLDMCRTALNVTGDLATAVVVSRPEREAAALSAS